VRWTILIEKYRTISNYTGTALVAWLLSAIVTQGIALFLPDSGGLAPASASRPMATDEYAMGEPFGQTLEYYMPICDRNIFDSQKRAPCTEEIAPVEGDLPIDENMAPVKSDIAATLLGTMVFPRKPNLSFATIADRGKSDSTTYRIGDALLGDAKIYDIVRHRVYFTRSGRKEYLEVENLPPSFYTREESGDMPPAGGPGVSVEGDKATISRAKVEETLGDLNAVVQQARMVPNFENGQVNGFKVFAIRPQSIFQQLGLRNGDVIHRINGTEINSVEKAIPMLQLARSSNQITLDVTRRGARKSMTIDIQ